MKNTMTISASLQCRLFIFFLKNFVKPQFQKMAQLEDKKQQLKIIQQVRKDNQSKFQLMLFTAPACVMTKDFDIENIPAIWVSVKGANYNRTVLYLHGGGYITGTSKQYLDFASKLSQSCSANVLLIDYRLVPENSITCALEDSLTAYKWLLENHPSHEVFIMGDSAGGGLALTTTIALRDENHTLPKAVVCVSPWTDLAATGKSIIENKDAEAFIVIPERLPFLDDVDKFHPYISPLYADLQGLPPMFIQVGKQEVLLDDARNFSDKAKSAGCDVTLRIWDNVPHAWLMFSKFLPEARQAIKEVGQFIENSCQNQKLAVNISN